MGLGYDQRTELRGQVRRILAFFAAAMLVLVITGADSKLFVMVAVGLVLINGTQLWASTRYGWTGPSVYARLLVSQHLPLLVKTLADNSWLASDLRLNQTDISRLGCATHAELENVSKFFRRAGWPRRHQPAQLTVFLLSLGTFVLGLLLGAYLPQYDQGDFQKLCGVSPARALTPTWPVILIATGVFVLALRVRTINQGQIHAVSKSFTRNPVEELSGLTQPQYAQRVPALQVDLRRAASLVGVSEAEAKALQSLGSTELGSRESLYTRIHWSPETDIIIAQVLFVLGLYLGLTVPPLLGIGC